MSAENSKGLLPEYNAGDHKWQIPEKAEQESWSWRIYSPPKVIGWWILPGSSSYFAYKIACYTKPRWFTIKMMKYILDFTWEDA
jgi:hypothetical protein